MGRVTVDSGGVPGQTSVTATMVSSDLLGDVAGSEGEKPINFVLKGTTDDRGEYRIAGMPAGKYRIGVRLSEAYYRFDVSGGRGSMEPTRTGTGGLMVFAPNALTKSDAKLVEVGDGDELTDIDVTVPMSRLYSIGGTVTQGGVPLAGAGLIIYRGGKRAMDNDAVSTSDGSYRFDLLPAGTYTIQAMYPTELTVPYQAHSRHFHRKMTFQVIDSDILDANIDVPTTVQASTAGASR